MRILLTGGSACGKSTFAEHLVMQFAQPRYYVATMRSYDEESLIKIARHQAARREKGFETIERDVDIASVEVPPGSTVLLECLCNLTANELIDGYNQVYLQAYEKIIDGVMVLASRCANIIVVTNDVGSGTAGGYDYSTNLYVEVLGRLNAELAASFDVVYELICGIPLLLKGKPVEVAAGGQPAAGSPTTAAHPREVAP